MFLHMRKLCISYEVIKINHLFNLLPCSESVTSYALHLEKKHDVLLESLFEVGTYKKLYSYRHLVNGFAVHMSPEQVNTSLGSSEIYLI